MGFRAIAHSWTGAVFSAAQASKPISGFDAGGLSSAVASEIDSMGEGAAFQLMEVCYRGGLDMGAGAEVTRLYYYGNSGDIKVRTFTGFRIQGLAGVSIGFEVTGSVSFSRLNRKEFVLGIGNGIGVGLGLSPMPGVGISGNVTYGYSFVPQF